MKRRDNKSKREIGASLPDDLKKEYKEYFYNEQAKNFQRKVNVMHDMKESMNDFKNKMKSPIEIDHKKAQKKADVKRNEMLDKKIIAYIEEKGLNVKDVKVITKAENIQLMYVNESGEIIREDVDIFKLNEKKI